MSEIDHLLQEHRRFPPSEAWAKSANIADPGVYERAARDPEAFWAEFARELEWIRPWDSVLKWDPPHARWFDGGQDQRERELLDRHVRTARRNKAAIIWEGEPGDRRTLTYWDLVPAGQHVRQRAQITWREAWRSRRPVSSARSRARDCDAGVRPNRRGPQRRLRRLQRRVAARSHQRLTVRPARHGRWRLPPRPDRPVETHGRRGAARDAVNQARRRRPASSVEPGGNRSADDSWARSAGTTG